MCEVLNKPTVISNKPKERSYSLDRIWDRPFLYGFTIFLGSQDTPSQDTTWPKKSTCFWKKTTFLGLNLKMSMAKPFERFAPSD